MYLLFFVGLSTRTLAQSQYVSRSHINIWPTIRIQIRVNHFRVVLARKFTFSYYISVSEDGIMKFPITIYTEEYNEVVTHRDIRHGFDKTNNVFDSK